MELSIALVVGRTHTNAIGIGHVFYIFLVNSRGSYLVEDLFGTVFVARGHALRHDLRPVLIAGKKNNSFGIPVVDALLS